MGIRNLILSLHIKLQKSAEQESFLMTDYHSSINIRNTLWTETKFKSNTIHEKVMKFKLLHQNSFLRLKLNKFVTIFFSSPSLSL